MRGGARHLTRDHRVIGRGQSGLRHHSHLVLARAIFGEKGVRHDARAAQGGDERLTEATLSAKGAERISVARPVGDASVEKFLFERRDKAHARNLFQLVYGAAQEIARAAFPRTAVGVADVPQEEVLDRRTVAKIDLDLDRRVGNDHEVPGGAKGRIPDRSEGRHHQIAASPAHALFEPCWQLARREALPAHQSRDVTGRDKNEFFPDHATTLSDRFAVYEVLPLCHPREGRVGVRWWQCSA